MGGGFETSQSPRPSYAWLNKCDSLCISKLGNAPLAWIDSRNCEELQGMLEGMEDSTSVVSIFHRLAIKDKMTYDSCS